MTLLYAFVSVVQFFAIAYLLMVALENFRAYTLMQNSEWLLKNSDFVSKYRKPSGLLIFLTYGVVLAGFFSFIGNSLETAWIVKNGGILIALLVLTTIHTYREKMLEKQIPSSTIRIAVLEKRTIDSYVSKFHVRSAIAAPVALVMFILLSFSVGRISLSELTFDLLFASLVYGIAWGTIIHVVKKKEPHSKDLEKFSSESIIVNYRTFSVKLMIGAVFVFTLFMLIFTAVQWSDKVLFITPLYLKVYSWFGDTVPDVLISKYLWDVIVSLFSSFLFFYMGFHKSFQSYRSSKLFQ